MSKNNASVAINKPNKEFFKAPIISKPLTARQPNIRNLSQKQMREIIDEIYASKSKFDQKCAENKQPRETMEQHIYSFLNQKYGLNSIV